MSAAIPIFSYLEMISMNVLFTEQSDRLLTESKELGFYHTLDALLNNKNHTGGQLIKDARHSFLIFSDYLFRLPCPAPCQRDTSELGFLLFSAA
jgi:hypothetical protein